MALAADDMTITTERRNDDWKPTACSLCYVNCGIEVRTDGHAIVRVRGDKAHPHTKGYLCQKAQRLTWMSDNADRLTTPLRRRADGTHEPVDWDTALGDIAARLTAIRDADRAAGRQSSFAYYGGGGQGNTPAARMAPRSSNGWAPRGTSTRSAKIRPAISG